VFEKNVQGIRKTYDHGFKKNTHRIQKEYSWISKQMLTDLKTNYVHRFKKNIHELKKNMFTGPKVLADSNNIHGPDIKF
jgi:hypothetical protein